MPPKGLYRIPQHHLHGQSASTKRQSFNSMDFEDAEEPAPIMTNDGTAEAVIDEERAKRKREKRARKEAKKLKREAKADKITAELEKVEEKQPSLPVDATPAAAPVKNGRYGPRGPYKKREKGTDGTPASAANKRKRESEAPVDSPAVTDKGLTDADDWLGPNFRKNMENNKNSLARLASIFDQQVNKTATPTELPKKKPGRPVGSGTKTVVKSGETKPKHKKQKLEKPPITSSIENVSKVVKTPVQVPSVASALSSESKGTPVPLPQKSPGALKRSASEAPVKKTGTAHAESEVLVNETPLSQMSHTPATTSRVRGIPFSLPPAVSTTKKSPCTLESSPDLPFVVATNLAKSDKHTIGSQGSVNPLTSSQVDSLTTANLIRFKQPLNDAPRPRPRGRRSVSSAPSTASSSSATTSRSIRDMLMRPGKPYTRPGDENSPSTTNNNNNNKKKKHIEKHDEANLATFTSTFTASRRTVNFTHEAEYLDEYTDWLSDSEAAGPLPCLKQASGCTPRSEQALHLLRSPATITTASSASTTTASEDIARAQTATTFLRYTIQTRIPVPLGPLEGTFKLYCPKYTRSHVDRYACGQRTLTISSIAGLNPLSGAYTARLCIPPRSLPYPIQAFEAPPHASFRNVTLKTVAEGYKMDVVFLGNGYLVLRLDVQLLLTGRSGKGGKGRGIWQFLGVGGGAVVWEEVVDEVERQGRRLVARYDGR